MKRRTHSTRRIVVASTFRVSLREISLYYRDLRDTFPDAGARFRRLVEGLTLEILPSIARQPGLGRRFALYRDDNPVERRWVASVEAVLAEHPGAELREWLSDQFALLYVVTDAVVVFVALKHHR